MRDFLKRRTRKQEETRERFGPLTAKELEGLAGVPWDDGMLRVTVHLIRARRAEAVARLARAREERLEERQVWALCGTLETAERLEADLTGLVEQGQAARARAAGG